MFSSYSGDFPSYKNSSEFLLLSFLMSAGCEERRLDGILSVSYRGNVWGGKAQAKESNKTRTAYELTYDPLVLHNNRGTEEGAASPGYREI